ERADREPIRELAGDLYCGLRRRTADVARYRDRDGEAAVGGDVDPVSPEGEVAAGEVGRRCTRFVDLAGRQVDETGAAGGNVEVPRLVLRRRPLIVPRSGVQRRRWRRRWRRRRGLVRNRPQA